MPEHKIIIKLDLDLIKQVLYKYIFLVLLINKVTTDKLYKIRIIQTTINYNNYKLISYNWKLFNNTINLT